MKTKTIFVRIFGLWFGAVVGGLIYYYINPCNTDKLTLFDRAFFFDYMYLIFSVALFIMFSADCKINKKEKL